MLHQEVEIVRGQTGAGNQTDSVRRLELVDRSDQELVDRIRQLEKKPNQEKELEPYQVELLKLQRHLETHGQRMIVLFEGRDAAGKGGTIRRVTRYMNEKHYRVVALGKPSDEERSQWFLQRYVAQFPRGGEMVLFDRSWYNRAMVEPVLGFCTDREHQDFVRGVVGFEKDLVRQGTVLLKLYFSVTKKEQQRRFERRRDDPLRQWKLSEVDVQGPGPVGRVHRTQIRDARAHAHQRDAVDDHPVRRQAPGPDQRHEGDARGG